MTPQSFFKYFLLLIFTSISIVALAQKDVPILTSICVQNAYTNEQVMGVQVIVDELDTYNNNVLHSDTLGGTIFISKSLISNHKYRLTVRKEGFYLKDTTIIPQTTSHSNKQRLGLPLYPMVCYYLSGKVINATTTEKINKGKLIIQNLTTNETSETNIQHGSYKFCGVCSHQYKITSIIEGYLNKTETITLESSNCLTPHEQSVKLDMRVSANYEKAFFDGNSIFIPNLTFIENSLTLSMQGEEEIKRLIQFLEQQPQTLISIAVQSASFIEHRLNRKLAEQRARQIEHKLTHAGIAAHRYLLICKGKVDKNPSLNKKQIIKISLRQ